jgi:hypothetical protein
MCAPVQTLLNVWAVIGPPAGIVLGNWLATRNQRKHWPLDNKRAEYRELLTTIAEAGGKFVVFYGTDPVAATGEQRFLIGETARISVDVIYNRLFIAEEIENLNIQRRWEESISTLRKTHNVDAFGKSLDEIMRDIRGAALRDVAR